MQWKINNNLNDFKIKKCTIPYLFHNYIKKDLIKIKLEINNLSEIEINTKEIQEIIFEKLMLQNPKLTNKEIKHLFLDKFKAKKIFNNPSNYNLIKARIKKNSKDKNVYLSNLEDIFIIDDYLNV